MLDRRRGALAQSSQTLSRARLSGAVEGHAAVLSPEFLRSCSNWRRRVLVVLVCFGVVLVLGIFVLRILHDGVKTRAMAPQNPSPKQWSGKISGGLQAESSVQDVVEQAKSSREATLEGIKHRPTGGNAELSRIRHFKVTTAAARIVPTENPSRTDLRYDGYYAPSRQPTLDANPLDFLVWLPSHPYSGSHLVRRVVEAATLRPTYSVYSEDGTHAKQMEGAQIAASSSASVEHYMHDLGLQMYRTRTACEPLVLKTHFPYSPYESQWHQDYPLSKTGPRMKIIRLIRNPWDQVMRVVLGTKVPDAFYSRIRRASKRYMDFHRFWKEQENKLSKQQQRYYRETLQPKEPCSWGTTASVLVVKYEDLCQNLEQTMLTILDFAGVPKYASSKHNKLKYLLSVALDREKLPDPSSQIGKHSFQKSKSPVKDSALLFDYRAFQIINNTCRDVIEEYGYYQSVVPHDWR